MTTKTTTRARRTVKTEVPAKTASARPAAKKASDSAKKDQSVSKLPYEKRNWTYLEDKEPTDLHETFAASIRKLSGVEVTPKQVQAVLSMHPSFQRSETNHKRAGYVGLDTEIKTQRSVHMVQAHKDARENIAKRNAAPANKRAARKTTAKKSA